MYNQLDKKRIKKIMDKVFINNKEYPINAIIPSISADKNGRSIISMLILADDNNLKHFLENMNDEADVEITTYLRDNYKNMGKDLIMRLHFYYKTGSPLYEALIPGELMDTQKDFIKALQIVNEFYVWIANRNREPEKIIRVSWDYNYAKDILEDLLKEYSNQ